MIHGKHVKIDPVAIRIWVKDWLHGWEQIPLERIQLNEYWPGSLKAGGTKYDLTDIGLNFRSVSRMLGVMRLDRKSASEIWHAQTSIRGNNLAVDLTRRELVLNFPVRGEYLKPGLVYPFGCFAGILGSGESLVEKRRQPGTDGYWPIGSFPFSGRELAGHMGIPFLKSEPIWQGNRVVLPNGAQ